MHFTNKIGIIHIMRKMIGEERAKGYAVPVFILENPEMNLVVVVTANVSFLVNWSKSIV